MIKGNQWGCPLLFGNKRIYRYIYIKYKYVYISSAQWPAYYYNKTNLFKCNLVFDPMRITDIFLIKKTCD